MPKRVSHTQRTLAYLRKERPDWIVQKVERWQVTANPKEGGPPGRRIDLFGFGDYLAMPSPVSAQGVYAIQVCAGSGIAAHVTKITRDPVVAPKAVRWLRLGCKILVIGWRKVSVKRGGKAKRWRPRIVQITREDFEPVDYLHLGG